MSNLGRSSWESLIQRWFQACLPEDYLCFDTETTGFSARHDLPLEIGYCVVRGRKIQHSGSFFLDWGRYPDLVTPDWLQDKLASVSRAMELQGRSWAIDYERLRTEGVDPFWAIRFLHELLDANESGDAAGVGHNLRFDQRIWNHVSQEYLGVRPRWPRDIWDTGVLEKWRLALSSGFDVYPKQGESLVDFLTRVHNARLPGVLWNLEGCLDRYDLCQRFNLCRDELHGAAADAKVCHYLLEDNRADVHHTGS